ncbi:MAG: class I SAM-dependent methyltransferase [Chitinophagaceae bacterium]|nr:class I SAM-dependent methyltransferase [Chitinophagaceae bacterium]
MQHPPAFNTVENSLKTITYPDCPLCGSEQISPALTTRDFAVTGMDFPVWHCQGCTLRFTQHAPAETDMARFYHFENYISHTETRKGLINKLYHRVRGVTLVKKKKWIEQSTGSDSGRLLDVGSGTGAFVHFMKRSGWEVTGLEPEEAARDTALRKYGLRLEPMDSFFQLPTMAFDVITLWHVLEHIHAVHDYLKNFKRILKPEGKLIIAVPNYTSLDARIYREYWAAWDVPRHLYHFSPEAMQVLLGLHGFRIRQIYPMWYDSFYISMISSRYKNGYVNYPAAVLNGLRSNLTAWINRLRCSSLTYVAEAG